jgi:hypothetical protein
MTGRRLDILDLERLRALDPTLAGELPSSATFVTWLRHAVRHGRISEDLRGFYLSPAQCKQWRRREGGSM